MATLDELRTMAMRLPGTNEVTHFGGPCFRVDKKQFALYWVKEERTVLKLPKKLQDMLFEVAADTFEPVQVGRSYWSYVAIEDLMTDELAHYVQEA